VLKSATPAQFDCSGVPQDVAQADPAYARHYTAGFTDRLADEARATHTHGVRDILLRCLHSDLDVLLPKMGTAGASELFFIVVDANVLGSESLNKRIRAQFDNCAIQMAGLTFSTSYRSIEMPERGAGDSMEISLQQMAVIIQVLVDEELASSVLANG
jgi:hypothetical protein